MSESAMRNYFEMLARKISVIYSVTIDSARNAVANSVIQDIARKYPEHVGHVSITEWAEEVYTEMYI